MKTLSARRPLFRACAVAAAALALAATATAAQAAVSSGSLDPCLDASSDLNQVLCGDAVSSGSLTGPDLGGSITTP